MRYLKVILIVVVLLCEIHGAPDTICLNDCSNKGVCRKGVCDCFQGFGGMDCSEHECPKGIDWFNTSKNDVECSGRGSCKLGKCECDPGFYGESCDSFNITNKDDCEKVNHGKYVLLDVLSGRNDKNDKRIYGCKCNKGYSGVNCENGVEKTCPFGVNITTSDMEIHYSQFKITAGKKVLLMKIKKDEKANDVIVKDKTILEVIENIKKEIGIKLVKVSECDKVCEDISNNNDQTLEGGKTYRFTFPLNKEIVVSEVIEGDFIIDSNSGITNGDINTYDFTTKSDAIPSNMKIKITKDTTPQPDVDISSTTTISTIVTAITTNGGVSDVRIYKDVDSKWIDITSDSQILAVDTKYRFIFPSDSTVELTDITGDSDNSVIQDNIESSNKISTSEFTIPKDETAAFLILTKDSTPADVDILSETSISAIITKIKTTSGISDVRIYKYETNKWVDMSDDNGNKLIDGNTDPGTKYRFIFLLNSNVKLNIVSDGQSATKDGNTGSGKYYTEAYSQLTIPSGKTAIMIRIQNTISYSSSLSTFITDVTKSPQENEFSKIEVAISKDDSVDKIISSIINSNIVKMVKIYKCDASNSKTCSDSSNNNWIDISTKTDETLSGTTKYKFTFPLDPYAKVTGVISGESVVKDNKIEYSTDKSSSTSTFTIEDSKSANFITILNNGIRKVYDISSGVSSITGVKVCEVTTDSCVDLSSDSSNKLTKGKTYKFTFTNNPNATVTAVTDGESIVDGSITVNKNVFTDISVFGNSVVISECSGHGTCNRESGKCECKSGYGSVKEGENCQFTSALITEPDLTSTSICPFGYSWFGINNNIVHGLTECSNQGECNNGRCTCDKSGIFVGENCEKLNMRCKNGMQVKEPKLEGNDIFGYINMKCDCGSLYGGTDCSGATCPFGPSESEIDTDHKVTKTPPYYVLTCPTTTRNSDSKTVYRFEFTDSKRHQETSRKLRSGYTPKYWRKMLERINIMRSDVIITNNPTGKALPTIDYSETTKAYSICGGDKRPTVDGSGDNVVNSYRIYLPGYCTEDLKSPLGLKLIKEGEGTVDDNDIKLKLVDNDDNVIKCEECGGNGECNKVTRVCKCNNGFSSSSIKYERPTDSDKIGAIINNGDFKSKFTLTSGMKGDCSYKE